MNSLLQGIEWRRHLTGLVVLGIALILLIVSGLFYFDERAHLLAAQSGYQQQQTINLDANQSQQLLSDHLDHYLQLQDHGVIGIGRRLQWIESVRKLSDQYRIPLVDFTLERSYPSDETNTLYTHPEVTMFITPMTLQLEMRHEGDFYRYMEALAQSAQGLFSIESCELRREPDDEAQSDFKAQCALLWYAIQDITLNWEQAAL